MNKKELSMLEQSINILRDCMQDINYKDFHDLDNKLPKIEDLLNTVLENSNYSKDDIDKKTQLYLDIISSGMFVYYKDGKWALKDLLPLSFYDKIISENLSDDIEEDVQEQDSDLIVEDDFDESEDQEDEMDVVYKSSDYEDDEINVDKKINEFDEEEYNDIMDEYEKDY